MADEPRRPADTLRLRLRLLRWRLADHMLGEPGLLRQCVAAVAMLAGRGLWRLGRRVTGLGLVSKAHASGYSASASAATERWLASLVASERGRPGAFAGACREYVEQAATDPALRAWAGNPLRMLGTKALVLKSASDGEKGVVNLDYAFVFPLFLRFFDVERVAARYYIVLEPGWSGYCSPDILCYAPLEQPVFVQAAEPRDAAFLEALGARLEAVPTATNWWIDHRIVRPDPSIEKDVDLVMVAAWASYKRHWSFFECLARMRPRRRLKVALVGYPQDCSRAEIAALARLHGVLDQLELLEGLTPDQVSRQLNRARALVLWSRREGVNRAIIEAMLADVPVIVRKGFNYGYPYPHVNPRTGTFADEQSFPLVVEDVLDHRSRYSPRAWVMENMTCQHGTRILEERIRGSALGRGEPWTRGLVAKISGLHGQSYWDEADRGRFDADYAFLASCLRNAGRERTA